MSAAESAKIVIIGGGAVGCGVAYQLALAGKRDILLLEKESSVAAATSSQAAGLVGQVRSTVERIKLAQWSVATFSQMQQDPDTNPSWRQVGSLRVALSQERVAAFEKLATVAAEADLDVEFIDPARAKGLWPALDFSAAQAILYCPSDGYLQPYDLTMAYVKKCRQMGVRFETSRAATGLTLSGNRVTGVQTAEGTIECETVINAAGAHAYHVACWAGMELPIVPVRHEFLITVQCEGMDPQLPVVRIPDGSIYLRPEVGGLLLGGWEPDSLSTDPRKYTLQQEPPRLEADYDALAFFVEQMQPQFAPIEQLGIRSVFKGWPTFTPDGRFIVGPTKQVEGFVMAGGCNAHGVSGSAGIGRHVVESMCETTPAAYVRSLSPDRFSAEPWDWESASASARRIYETYYGIGD